MKNFFTKEVKVGLLILVALGMLIWGYTFLKGKDLFTSDRSYYVVLTNTSGIMQGSPVTINGVRVGSVSDIKLDLVSQKVISKFFISNNINLSNNTVATIASPDLMSAKELQLSSDFQSPFLKNGDTIKSFVPASMLSMLGKKVDSLEPSLKGSLENIQHLSGNINNMINPELERNLQISIANLKNTTSELSKFINTLNSNTGSLSSTMSNVSIFTKGLNQNNKNIQSVVSNLNDISGDLNKANLSSTIAKLGSTIENLNGVISKLDSTNGTAGLLLNDKQLYVEINKTLESVSNLLSDLKAHPSKYVNISLIGRKPKNDE